MSVTLNTTTDPVTLTVTGGIGPQGPTGPTGPASAWGTIPGTLANQTDLEAALNAKLPLAGGTMTGALTLAADPTTALEPATKQYTDAADALRLQAANNLSDLQSAATARTNLGLGSAATQNTGNLTEATSDVLTIGGGIGAVLGTGTTLQVKQASGTQDGFLAKGDWTTFNGKQAALGYTPLNAVNNLSDVSSAATARTNLGLGSAATQASSAFEPALGYTPLNKAGDTITGDIANTDTGYLQLPQGTTAQQPSSPATGMQRWNTTTGRLEVYNGSAWANHVRLTGDTMTGTLNAPSAALTALASTTVPLTVQGAASQSADMQDWKTSGGVVAASVGPTGAVTVRGNAGSDQPTFGAQVLGSSGWTSAGWSGSFGAGWTNSTGNTSVLSQSTAAVIGTKYQIAYTVTGRTAGSISIAFGGQAIGGVTASGAFGPTATATTGLSITPTSDFNGTIILSILPIVAGATPLYIAESSNGVSCLELRALPGSNSALGNEALLYNTTGSNNSAMGFQALLNNTTGSNNSAMGYTALLNNTTGSNNSAMGYAALYDNTTGSNNSALGNEALFNNTTGSNNSAMGYAALLNNTTGSYNSAMGNTALLNNTTGSNNSAMGNEALLNNTTGSNNSAMGYAALYDLNILDSSLGNNTAVGYNTGRGIVTGENNTILGANVTGLAAGLTNTVILADGSGNQRLYADSTGNVGLGIVPSAHLTLPAGIAAASGAPLKLTAGTLLTTPENGAVEFDGTHLYITIAGSRVTIV